MLKFKENFPLPGRGRDRVGWKMDFFTPSGKGRDRGKRKRK
jgi:hypothetical protein